MCSNSNNSFFTAYSRFRGTVFEWVGLRGGNKGILGGRKSLTTAPLYMLRTFTIISKTPFSTNGERLNY